jgi:membrane-bound metal-dependent hydrolase YbcI (DUF457 family)
MQLKVVACLAVEFVNGNEPAMSEPAAAGLSGSTEPHGSAPRVYGSHADAAAYIEELLDELADLAEAAGHRKLSHSILVAALQAAGIAARAGGRPG